MHTQKIKLKKLVILALLLTVATVVCATLAACDNDCKHVPSKPVTENLVEATDDAEGSCDEVTYCTVCGVELSRIHKTIPAHGHTAGASAKENVVAATCTNDGGYDMVVRCTTCNKVLESEHYTTDKLGHDTVPHAAQEPTCTAIGWEAYETCSRCNYSTYKELPQTNHMAATPVEEDKVAPNCESNGYCYTVVHCINPDCNYEFSREYTTLTALGHDYEQIAAKEATCTEAGWCAYERCTRCGITNNYQDVPPKNHQNVTRTELEIPSTCTKAGYFDVTYTCNDCDEVTYFEHTTYELAPHTPAAEFVKENETIADCYNAGGYDWVLRCTNPDCDHVFDKQHVYVPITHSPKEPVVENKVEPTYKYLGNGGEGGYDEVIYCNVCGDEISRKHTVTKITAAEYYAKYDYLELSATTNTPDNIITNEDGTRVLTVKTNGGSSVRLLIEGNIGSLDGGWGCFDENTKVYFLDALPGMNYISYELASTSDEFVIQGYCSLQQKTSVESVDELFAYGGFLIGGRVLNSDAEAGLYPDYLCLNKIGTSLQLVSLKIYYCDVMTEVVDIQLDTTLYTGGLSNSYLPGDWYDGKIEQGSTAAFNYGFPLKILLSNSESIADQNTIYYSLTEFGDNVKFGNVIDANENVVDKTNRFLQAGDKIEVTIGNCTRILDLCTEMYTGDTLYETSTITHVNTSGTQNVLVVPLTFTDQQDRINDTWMSLLKKALGNVMDADGNVTQYSLNNGELSLSEYLSTSSYGKFTTNFYIAEPYVIDGIGSNYFYKTMQNIWDSGIENSLHNQNFDSSLFDRNGDGYYDAVIFVNTLVMADGNGISYGQGTLSGAYQYSLYTDLSHAGTSEKPTINTFCTTSTLLLFGKQEELNEANVTTEVLIHEFGHTFGLMDYYINGNPQNTIGKFDMEADNQGDWNSYSKYLLGWVDPIVVNGTQDSVEFTIRSYATYGDVILVRALGYDGTGTPFDEYILIDLFAHDGLYAKDAADYGLSEAVGVRIYHINSIYDVTRYGEDGLIYAYPHLSADFGSKYSSQGKYLLEMVQKGNVNTFMKDFDLETVTPEEYLATYVDADDLFYQGDSFSVDEYDNFFYNGKMDNGMDFGYTITIKEIVENGADSTATIVISKKSA